MIRIALTALAIYLLWAFARYIFAAVRSARAKKDRGTPQTAEMVACAGCGTFVIRCDAVTRGGFYYCSETCTANKADRLIDT